MQAFVENLLLHIDDLSPLLVYGFFFLSGFLQIVFPPYPGDSVLVFGGCLGGAGGTAWAALLGYLTATLATSLALFELGYRLNRRIFSVPFIARIMPLEKRGEVENKYKKFGVGLLAVCKFIPGVNTLVVLLGGVLHYPRALGMGAITVSSVLHNLVFFYVGHILGRNLEAIDRFLKDYTLGVLLVIGLCAAGALAYWIIQRRKRRNQHDSTYSGRSRM